MDIKDRLSSIKSRKEKIKDLQNQIDDLKEGLDQEVDAVCSSMIDQDLQSVAYDGIGKFSVSMKKVIYFPNKSEIEARKELVTWLNEKKGKDYVWSAMSIPYTTLNSVYQSCIETGELNQDELPKGVLKTFDKYKLSIKK